MIRKFEDYFPNISLNVYISESAEIIGRVELNRGVSIWPQAVLRGDVEKIIVGENSNIQDGSLLHTNCELPVIIGRDVTIGHGVIIHGSRISDSCLIGMGAILLDGCEIEKNIIVAAGAIVPENKKLETGYVYMGQPAKKMREITETDIKLITKRAKEYVKLAGLYGIPVQTGS